METEHTTQEISRLRRCINDLASLLALPAMWTGQDCSRVISTLFAVLIRMLDLDFAYARITDPANGSPREWMQSGDNIDHHAEAKEVGQSLEPYLAAELPTAGFCIINPLTEGTASIAVFHLGAQDRVGVFVAASTRPEFPTELERLLLQVATSQAAIALQEARRIEQREASVEIERTRTKAALQNSEERFRQMADSIPETIRLIIDSTPALIHTALPDGYIDFFNQGWLRYLGVPLENLQGWNWTSVIHPDDLEGILQKWRASLASGAPFLHETRVRTADGEYRWMLHHKVAKRDEHGNIVKWYGASVDIDDRKRAEEEVKRLKNQLHRENIALREEIDKASMFEEIVGSSAALRKVLLQVAKVASTDATVLLTSETGTGKELIARAIHKRSRRSTRAFVSVNCAAVPDSLIASELFGHEKGAFTGALERRLGRFELAEGGTIFLDEIADLPADSQHALFRVLQEREIERGGGSGPIRVNVRVIAATNRDLRAAIADGTFRADLFYRLNVFPLEVPPLRKRPMDIPLLVEYFIHRYAKRAGKRIRGISKETSSLLQLYDWPGNIRELQNVIERAVILSDSDTLSIDEQSLSGGVFSPPVVASPSTNSLTTPDKGVIEAALRQTKGRVAGPFGAAVRLGMPSSTLESKIKALEIDKRPFKST